MRNDVHAPTVSYGFLSSAPPTPCGLATFTAALGSTLVTRGAKVSVVRVIDTPGEVSTSTFPVIGELVTSDSTSLEPAAQALNSCDVAIVQHEYGLYGGRDGADVLKVLHDVRVPSIAILHTVLSKPTSDQIQVLNEVIKDVDAVVVMTEGAATTLRSVHELGDTRLRVIPHGARVSNPTIRKSDVGTHWSGQRHRVGHRRHGETKGPVAVA
jgi:hypothetical protein